MRTADGYSEISDYGFLSDCRSAALVATDGSVDWLCWPRFDSPSLFGRILDSENGGFFQIAPTDNDYTVERSYLKGTNIISTVFHTPTGTVKIEDWLHVGARQSLMRLVTGVDGHVEMFAACDPRPQYGIKGKPTCFSNRLGYLTMPIDEENSLVLEGFDAAWDEQAPVIAFEKFDVQAGEKKSYALGLNRPGPSNALHSLSRAIEYWREWSDDLQVTEHVACKEVERAALVLKGLQYQPTGAIIAAATTSLPEQPGGERNYDYRYMWLRDSVFTLYALRSVGRGDEAESFFDFLKSLSLRHPDGDLQIIYGVGGETELPEQNLDHLKGYKTSRPVRIGNGAANQRQLDTLGEIADAISMHHRRTSDPPLTRHRWTLVQELAEAAAEQWSLPDEGIWEIRGPQQHFVYSKVMCWVALDRAIKLSAKAPEDLAGEQVDRWRRIRDEIKAEVMEKGYDPELGAFTQYYGSGSLDAANLLLARVGFISSKDEKFKNTVRATQLHLMRGGLVDRYRHDAVDDGFSGNEGTFTICTLWLVLALIEIGSLGEAEILFERVLGCASDLGLYSEELTPSGRQLGNFPQAFTHIALIVCAFSLERAYQREKLKTPAEAMSLAERRHDARQLPEMEKLETITVEHKLPNFSEPIDASEREIW